MSINYPQMLSDSILRLSELVRQRRQIEMEIRRVQTAVLTFGSRLQSADVTTARRAEIKPASQGCSPRLMEGIRQILFLCPIWLSPVEIRDLLPVVGVDSRRYK